jgi:hypothetical protein
MQALQEGSAEMRAQEARPKQEVGKEAEGSSYDWQQAMGSTMPFPVQVEESEEFRRSFELRSTHTMQDACMHAC